MFVKGHFFFSVFYKIKKMVNLQLIRNKQFTSSKICCSVLSLSYVIFAFGDLFAGGKSIHFYWLLFSTTLFWAGGGSRDLFVSADSKINSLKLKMGFSNNNKKGNFF